MDITLELYNQLKETLDNISDPGSDDVKYILGILNQINWDNIENKKWLHCLYNYFNYTFKDSYEGWNIIDRFLGENPEKYLI